MISWSFVLERIKDELGLPFQPLEKEDAEIIDYLKRNAVKKFSKYFPAKRKTAVDTSNPDFQVPNRYSEYYIVDPNGRNILDVINIYTTMSEDLVLGHPWIGVFTYDSVPHYALQVHLANTTKLWSIYNHTIEFSPPNILRITPIYKGRFAVEYEAELDSELSDLDPQLEDYFVELCLAMTMRQIGRIRRKYSNIQTPFGDIQLNAEELYSEGEQKLTELIEKFETGSMPNIQFDRG
jgi:hypothetical protein